ncbi:DUF3301 domain-containing protein [Francisellaceae bacterium]|nr:DUF3301 domain-containing protein [Francisellaceae bacterium]
MWSTTIFCLVLIFLIAIIWRNSLRAREHAIQIAKQTCKKIEVQFLDETVALRKIRLSRSDHGSLCLLRNYEFEYSTNNTDRKICIVQMRGYRLSQIFYRDEEAHTTVLSEQVQETSQTPSPSPGPSSSSGSDYNYQQNNVISFANYKSKNDHSNNKDKDSE